MYRDPWRRIPILWQGPHACYRVESPLSLSCLLGGLSPRLSVNGRRGRSWNTHSYVLTTSSDCFRMLGTALVELRDLASDATLSPGREYEIWESCRWHLQIECQRLSSNLAVDLATGGLARRASPGPLHRCCSLSVYLSISPAAGFCARCPRCPSGSTFLGRSAMRTLLPATSLICITLIPKSKTSKSRIKNCIPSRRLWMNFSPILRLIRVPYRQSRCCFTPASPAIRITCGQKCGWIMWRSQEMPV